MNPTLCFGAGCDSRLVRVVFGDHYEVCGDCGLIIKTLIDCPRQNPYPDPKPAKKMSKSQSKKEMSRQIKMSKIIQGAKSDRSYDQNITKLLKKYK